MIGLESALWATPKFVFSVVLRARRPDVSTVLCGTHLALGVAMVITPASLPLRPCVRDRGRIGLLIACVARKGTSLCDGRRIGTYGRRAAGAFSGPAGKVLAALRNCVTWRLQTPDCEFLHVATDYLHTIVAVLSDTRHIPRPVINAARAVVFLFRWSRIRRRWWWPRAATPPSCHAPKCTQHECCQFSAAHSLRVTRGPCARDFLAAAPPLLGSVYCSRKT